MLQEEFVDKVTPNIDFTDEAVVQWDVSVVKNSSVGSDNLQMITNHNFELNT